MVELCERDLCTGCTACVNACQSNVLVWKKPDSLCLVFITRYALVWGLSTCVGVVEKDLVVFVRKVYAAVSETGSL